MRDKHYAYYWWSVTFKLYFDIATKAVASSLVWGQKKKYIKYSISDCVPTSWDNKYWEKNAVQMSANISLNDLWELIDKNKHLLRVQIVKLEKNIQQN